MTGLSTLHYVISDLHVCTCTYICICMMVKSMIPLRYIDTCTMCRGTNIELNSVREMHANYATPLENSHHYGLAPLLHVYM